MTHSQPLRAAWAAEQNVRMLLSSVHCCAAFTRISAASTAPCVTMERVHGKWIIETLSFKENATPDTIPLNNKCRSSEVEENAKCEVAVGGGRERVACNACFDVVGGGSRLRLNELGQRHGEVMAAAGHVARSVSAAVLERVAGAACYGRRKSGA
ncbi:hypothetical protein K437DRAFT_35604 [Tilletiaria anomala UBC 951]|uniref:Uncharacterized protein n=1 Tax=Tilletiaria anomala (strain ATCC 24038 / CBS 436.72 / UBC 951) TaxID=1037660 RepID=A0A066VG59_TILAU|nr:uncharacterized protein K437DRAFT_35604 [Tilletiaria anomala UBC 951]KDN37744.1 hypothetical protein K437DRAFT_35604 [Tilletiaria anomala UBC 951]